MNYSTCIPFCALKKILTPIVFRKVDFLHEWKEKLPIIGVCQLWRHLCLNFVYNQAFFEDYGLYLSKDKTLRQRRGRYLYQHNFPSKKPLLVSNIDLLEMLDRCYTVVRMDIDAYRYGSQHLFFDEITRMLRQTRGDWFRVSELYIYQWDGSETDELEYHLPDKTDNEYDLGPIVEYAKSNFTGITNISCGELDILIGRLGSQLQLQHAGYISEITSDMSLLSSSLKYLPQNITGLDLTFDKTNLVLYLPIICAESLMSLKLRDLPPMFDWTCFQNLLGPRSTSIVFKQLYYLSIFYGHSNEDKKLVCDQPGPINGFYIKLSFPSLAYFYVRNCSTNNSLLHAEFPNDASMVEYRGSIYSIALCQQIKIKSRELRQVVTSVDKDEEIDFYKTTNKIFADNHQAEEIGLLLESVFFPINIDLIKWDNLYSLDASFHIGFMSFVLILRKLSNLEHLSLQADSITSIVETLDHNFVNAAINSAGFVLCTNLRTVKFNGGYDPYTHVEMLELLEMFVACCLNIRQINTDYVFKEDLEYFIISHFASIKEIEDFISNKTVNIPILEEVAIVYGFYR